jgi:hypothetical protein
MDTKTAVISGGYETHFVYVEFGEELGRHAMAYVDFVRRTGRTVVVVRDGKPMCQMIPESQVPPKKKPAQRD